MSTTIPELHTDDEDLVVTHDGPVATLWLNRPHKRNAITFDMWNGIAAICRGLTDDPGVRLLVVRGVGDHFCAGADIGGLGDRDGAEYRSANESADHALASFPKPTLAVITGSCIGGGAEIAVACDLRMADTTARFGITPARLGMVYPASATRRLVRTIGAAAAKHLLFSAELIGADRALRIGLIDELHGPDELASRVDEFSDVLALQRSLLTQMASKAIVDAAVDGPVHPAVTEAWFAAVDASDDPTEGAAAFLERRAPRFTWTPHSRG